MAEITVKDLRHTYSMGTPFAKTAIDGISLNIGKGENIFLLGHTGSGKTTFVQHLNALLQPTGGVILADGKDINADKLSRRDIKRRVGMVFQYPEYQLFEETVEKDIAFGPKNMGLPENEIQDRVSEAAEFVGISRELLTRSPLELSGGQKRRIAIAGVIAMRPEVLILDEPTAGLDPLGSRQIMDNIQRYRDWTGATTIVVSHNMDDAARYGKRLIVFDRGKVRMDGSPEEVFGRASELLSIGLNVPKATALASALKDSGLPISGAIYTHEQLLSAIHNARGSRAC